MLHRHAGPGHASFLRLRRHRSITHKAENLAAVLLQPPLVDAGLRHLRVRHDAGSGPDGLPQPRHHIFRKAQGIIIGKVRRGMDHPLHNRCDLRRQRRCPLSQLLRDDLKAPPLNVRRQNFFR